MNHDDLEREAEEEREYVSNLELTIDKIGMGRYQVALLILCGFGWMADNMWLEAVAIILPRVQDHYSISDRSIGVLSTSIFFGMMLGSIGWGTCSDLLGRTLAFNSTLLLTGVFGFTSAYLTYGLKSLCVSLFFLGTAIGGSMPTDGTLFIENIPRRKQWLLVALSVFFSFGAVLSAVAGLIIIPSNSCPEPPEPCDVATQNKGWRILLSVLSIFTILMFVGRFILFSLEESPRYLVNTGRPAEAVHALQHIAEYNGKTMQIGLEDVQDNPEPIFSAETDELELPGSPKTPIRAPSSIPLPIEPKDGSPPSYDSTSRQGSPLTADRYTSRTPTEERAYDDLWNSANLDTAARYAFPPSPVLTMRSHHSRRPSSAHLRRRSSMSVKYSEPTWKDQIVEWVSVPVSAWWEKTSALFTDEYRRSTLLVWAAWMLMSLAYTMFNVYLPKLLESRLGHTETGGRKRALWDVVIFTLGGCPGAILGAWMIDTRLGRKRSLAVATFLTAVFCVGFCQVTTQVGVSLVSIFISLAATTMWAILYGITPDIFPPNIRGTACGTASALSRIGGMIAPILGGHLLARDSSLPMYSAAAILTVAAACVLLLPTEGENKGGNGYNQLSH